MTTLRGTVRNTDTSKQNLITKEVYTGEINRSYENKPKYTIIELNGSSHKISSDKPLEVLEKMDKYKNCKIIPNK